MKIVIDIDNETYGRIQALVNADYFEHDICGYSMQRIANGTPYEERPTGEWIPVSVQEPAVGGIYLVTAKHVISGHIGTDIARRISDNIWTFGGEELSGTEIIAWMPLPLPYEQEEAENDK